MCWCFHGGMSDIAMFALNIPTPLRFSTSHMKMASQVEHGTGKLTASWEDDMCRSDVG